MKKLLTLSILILTVMLTSTSFADWTLVTKGVSGNTYYLDFERIRKVDGYVYYWSLADLLKPSKYGDLFHKIYWQGDCKLFRYKALSYSFHEEPMGEGVADSPPPPDEWKYPIPKSSNEIILSRM